MNLFSHTHLITCLAVLAAAWSAPHALAQSQRDPMTLRVILVWATDDESSPDPAHKEVSPELRAKIKKTPSKWENYFEIARQKTTIRPKRKRKLSMSDQCDLEITNLGDGRIEVKTYGKKKLVGRNVQAMPMGETLILGGPAENETAWLIIIKRVERSN